MLSMKATSIFLLLIAVLNSSNAAPHNGKIMQYNKMLYLNIPEQPTGGCPGGTLPIYCLINPCQYASCPAFEDATCVADYCGGCNARWILNGQEVTDQCEGRNYHWQLHMHSMILDLCHTLCVYLSK